MTSLTFNPLCELLGAEITDFDCRPVPEPKTQQAIVTALHEHQVLVFRNQDLSPDQQIAFSEAFGPLEMHVNQANHGYERPNFHVVTNLGEDGQPMPEPPPEKAFNGTTTWHTDKSYMPRPSMATFLYGLEVTATGGETMFASLTAAYDALDAPQKSRLGELHCVHSWEQSLRNSSSRPATEQERRISPPVTHPLIRTHPGNGRKALYIGHHASHIAEMDEAQGRSLLFELLDYATQERFVFTHKWRQKDLVIWDNPSLVHKSAPYDRQRQRRHLNRTVVRGGVPF
jgi:alpha-ketoglutarate-dependent taurine dioxygenase